MGYSSPLAGTLEECARAVAGPGIAGGHCASSGYFQLLCVCRTILKPGPKLGTLTDVLKVPSLNSCRPEAPNPKPQTVNPKPQSARPKP